MVSTNYYENLPQEQPPHTTLSHQSILIKIIQTALKPHLFQVKIKNILDYIIEQKHLGLGERAVFFLIDQTTETMTLKITNRLTSHKDMPCSDHPIGICHCGQVAQSGKPQYFSTPPPLRDFSSNPRPFPGTYCIPIQKDGIPLAVLSIYSSTQQPPTDDVKTLLEAIANIFAVIIETQQMDQQLIKLVNDLRTSVINLREEKKFPESIIQGLKYGLIVADLDGKIRKSNSAAETILKSFTNHLDDKYLADIFSPESAEKLLEILPSGVEQLDREISALNQQGEITISAKIIGMQELQGYKKNHLGLLTNAL